MHAHVSTLATRSSLATTAPIPQLPRPCDVIRARYTPCQTPLRVPPFLHAPTRRVEKHPPPRQQLISGSRKVIALIFIREKQKQRLLETRSVFRTDATKHLHEQPLVPFWKHAQTQWNTNLKPVHVCTPRVHAGRGYLPLMYPKIEIQIFPFF